MAEGSDTRTGEKSQAIREVGERLRQELQIRRQSGWFKSNSLNGATTTLEGFRSLSSTATSSNALGASASIARCCLEKRKRFGDKIEW